jgi:hypothetical protein
MRKSFPAVAATVLFICVFVVLTGQGSIVAAQHAPCNPAVQTCG